MRLYIDPGTGSMLFAILIGLLGALRYLLKAWLGGRAGKAAACHLF